MPGAGLTGFRCGQAPSDKPAFQPYWGKPAVRNERGDGGNVGIIRSPVRAAILPDRNLGKPHSLHCHQGRVAVEGNQRPLAMGCEESYQPIVPMKMGNRRATEDVAATGPIGGKGRTNERIG